MKNKLFETSPRLYLLFRDFTGLCFFTILAVKIFIFKFESLVTSVLFLLSICTLLIGAFVYKILSIQVVIITKTNIILKHFFLDKKICFCLTDVTNIFHNYTENLFSIDGAAGNGFGNGNMYNTYKTTLVLTNNIQYHLFTIMPYDYAILRNYFDQIKNGNTDLELKKNTFKSYLEQNKDGFPILFLNGLFLMIMFCLFFFS